MKRSGLHFLLFGWAAFLVCSMIPQARASELSYARIVRVSLTAGDVQVARPGHSGWEPAAENMPIEQGFTIGTTDGRAEIQFEDGAVLWISDNSVVQFTELALSDGGRITRLTFGPGTFSVYANLKRADSFTVVTPDQEIVVPKRALFRVDSSHNRASISVWQGGLRVASPAGTNLLEKGETFVFRGKSAGQETYGKDAKYSEWDQWVSHREQALAVKTVQARSYADSPFLYGLADLSDYGSWNYFPGYGYGWQPAGAGSCWMPFMNGNWSFYPGLGWTWISAEPWGWVPYHFGSWSYSPSYGWFWMPTSFNFWNPAPVQWYQVGNQIGWLPDTFGDLGMMDAFGAGCGGFGPSLGYQNTIYTAAATGSNTAPTPGNAKRPIGRRSPVPPRFLLTTGSKNFGRGGAIRMISTEQRGKSLNFMPAPPMESGKPYRFSETGAVLNFNARIAAAESSRTVVPTAADLGRLRASLGARGSVSPALRTRVPSAPMPGRMPALSVRNAAPRVSTMPHPPSPMMRFPGNPFPAASRGMGGTSIFNPAAAGQGMPAAAAPMPASPAPARGPETPRVTPGRPH